MSQNKTEKPTPKKKKDAAKEGQTFKSKDLIATCLIMLGISVLLNFVTLTELKKVFNVIIESHYTLPPFEYFIICIIVGAKILLPVLAMGIIATVVPGLMQSGAQLATKALKLKFDSLNPVKGIKKIFSLRTIKELVKTLLFMLSFGVATFIFWQRNRAEIIRMVYGKPEGGFYIWGEMFFSLIVIVLVCILLVVLLDCICEFLLWIKEIKMDKKEVEREHKELNGNAEIKGRRKELHRELLSEETQDVIRKSDAIIVNPTHIAVGIYIKRDITFIPFISLIETDAKALAVKRYAKQVGTPIIEDIPMARKIYETHKVNSLLDLECFPLVMDILLWLDIVEMDWLQSHLNHAEPTEKPENTLTESGMSEGKTLSEPEIDNVSLDEVANRPTDATPPQ